MNLEKTIKNLKNRNFKVSYFATRAEASEYLNSQMDGSTIGIGGCKTAEELGLFQSLSQHNEVFWHWKVPGQETYRNAAAARYYISSANAISEDGEILNIDGRGNRVASTLFGHEKLFIVAGVNKIEENFEAALSRARNVAAVTNVKRFDMPVPCKIDDKCHDCRVPGHACNALVVLWSPMMDMETEVVLIGEELGY